MMLWGWLPIVLSVSSLTAGIFWFIGYNRAYDDNMMAMNSV